MIELDCQTASRSEAAAAAHTFRNQFHNNLSHSEWDQFRIRDFDFDSHFWFIFQFIFFLLFQSFSFCIADIAVQ